MTKMLVSVTGPDEARIALAGGADVIDLGDPAGGPLGAVPPEVLAATIEAVAGRRPVAAAAGALPMDPETVEAAVLDRRAADFVRVGLLSASRREQEAVIERLARSSGEIALIGVLLADAEPDLSLLPLLAEAGFAGAMLDTMGKEGRRLLTHLSVGALAGFVEQCRGLRLTSGLAGSLEAPDVPRLCVLKPDWLGFRGALTAGAGDEAIDEAAVRAIRALFPAETSASPEPVRRDGPTDRIFVRDFTLDMAIGAYGFERGRTQKVRFSVEADVLRPAGRRQALADIYSYDIVMDAIRTLAARGHTDLVETLADELAATVLADPRIAAVTVKVEKLELGPAAVGVEIHRRAGG